jgi:hypothetical protein
MRGARGAHQGRHQRRVSAPERLGQAAQEGGRRRRAAAAKPRARALVAAQAADRRAGDAAPQVAAGAVANAISHTHGFVCTIPWLRFEFIRGHRPSAFGHPAAKRPDQSRQS